MNLPVKKEEEGAIELTTTVKTTTDNFQPPKKDSNDTAQDLSVAVLKKLAENIPIVGGIMSEVINYVIKPIHERRMEAWFERIGAALSQVQKEVLDLKSLNENEEFATVFIEASQIAVKTHQEEKRELLANAVINSILRPIEFDKEHLFLEIVDRLTERHILIMKDIKFENKTNKGFDMQNFKVAITEKYFNGDVPLRELYFKQLIDYHFLTHFQSTEKGTRVNTFDLTKIAEEFLTFISPY